jgi:hypothetical protein
MICPSCGKKSWFDIVVCPKCGWRAQLEAATLSSEAPPNEKKSAIPPGVGQPTITIVGTFRKVCVKALGKRQFGKYRRDGKLTIANEGIKIEGRHAMSLGAQWGIGILIWIGTAIVTVWVGFVVGWLPIYLMMGHVILKREDISIPWAKINKYAFEPERRLVAIDFEGPAETSPVVMAMSTSELAQAAKAIRANAPERDATPSVQFE